MAAWTQVRNAIAAAVFRRALVLPLLCHQPEPRGRPYPAVYRSVRCTIHVSRPQDVLEALQSICPRQKVAFVLPPPSLPPRHQAVPMLAASVQHIRAHIE